MDSFFGPSLDKNITEIDLHGIPDIHEALQILEKELFQVGTRGQKYCRVIHGIGSGRLADAVEQALQENPMVYKWKRDEDGGSCIVLF